MPHTTARTVIVGIVNQYALARGHSDIEYSVCRMTSGRNKTFEDGDPELDAFIEDPNGYWFVRGWELIERDGRNVLRPKQSGAQGGAG